MSINSKLWLVFALLVPAELCAAGFVEPLTTVKIVSDFGWRASSSGAPGKHDGIDYSASSGTSIRSVESSRITSIGYGPVRGWHVEANSIANSSAAWRYFHLFNRSGTRNNRSGSFQVIRHNGDFLIVHFLPTNIPDVAYTDRPSLHNSTAVISVPSTHTVTLKNEIPAGTFFAPVGRTGRAFAPHLHLEFSDRSYRGSPSKRGSTDLYAKNAFVHVPHTPSNFTVTIFSPLPITSGQGVFMRPSDVGYDPATGISTLRNLAAYVNSTVGLDLNRIEFKIAGVIVAGYDYEGALSTRAFPVEAAVRPLFDPSLRDQKAGKDYFLVPAVSVPGINLTVGCFILGVHAFNVREVEFTREIELCPPMGAPPRVRTSTHAATSTYDGVRFVGRVPFTVESDAPVAKVQLFRMTEQGRVLLGTLGAGGTTPDLQDGSYSILAQDINGRIGGVRFRFSTSAGILGAYLPASTATYQTVGISTVIGGGGYSVALPDFFEGSISSQVILSTGAQYSLVMTSTDSPPTPVLTGFITATQLVSVSSAGSFFDVQIVLGDQVAGDNEADLSEPSGLELELKINNVPQGHYYASRELTRQRTFLYENQSAPLPLSNPIQVDFVLKSNSLPVCSRREDVPGQLVTSCNDVHTETPRITFDVAAYFQMEYRQHVFTPGESEALGSFNVLPGEEIYEDPLATVGFTSTATASRVDVQVVSELNPESNLTEIAGRRYVRIPGTFPVGITRTGLGSVVSPHTIDLRYDSTFVTPEQVSSIRVVRDGQIISANVSHGNARVSLPASEGGLGIFSLVIEDNVAPAAVLPVAASVGEDSISFEWAATGDDGVFGQAAGYQARWAQCDAGTASFDFDAAAPVFPSDGDTDEDAGPSLSGEMDGITLDGLTPGATYCIGIKVFDFVGNITPQPAVAMAATSGRAFPAIAVSQNRIAGLPELEFEYTVGPDATVSDLDEQSSIVQQYLNRISQDRGQQLLSQLYEVGPSGTNHNPAATIRMRYNPDALIGFDPASMEILESAADGQSAFPIENLVHDAVNRVISGQVRFLNSKFGIFATPMSSDNEIASGGLAIGADISGKLWSVVLDGDAVLMTRTDSVGTTLSSTLLPDAVPSSGWSVVFDDAGSPYAIGTAVGPNTAGADLAVYKASLSGTLISSKTFDSGYAKNDYVFAASPPGWIVGAVQTAGPVEGEGPGQRFQLGLWHFNAATGSVELTTTYTRGADFDAATGVSVDADGNVWIAGFSANPQAVGSRPIDLALWKYSPQAGALSGPYLRPGYLKEFNISAVARLLATETAVYVAAPRVHGTSNASDSAFLRFGPDGSLQHESAWRPASGRAAVPSAVLSEPGDKIRVAGGLEENEGVAALWLHENSGSLISVTSVEGGAARGAARSAGELWLAVANASVPVKVQVVSALSGSASDVLPPRTIYSITGSSFGATPIYITSTSIVALSAVDDKLIQDDGLGQVDKMFYSLDGSSFAPVVGPIMITAEGLHALRFWSSDADGSEEPLQTISLAVDLTAPTGSVQAAGGFYELIAQDPVSAGVASGVREIHYFVDIAPESCEGIPASSNAPRGTCENPAYGGPFALSPGTHTVGFVLTDHVGNGQNYTFSSQVVVPQPEPPIVSRSLSWTGAGGDGLWHTSANWDPAVVPTSFDTATLPSGSTVVVAPGADAVFARLVLGPSVLRVGSALIGGKLVLNDGAMLVSESTRTFQFASVDALAGSVLTHSPVVGGVLPVISFDVSGDMVVAVGARVDVAGQGYQGGAGRGPGPGGGQESGGGAGHGGLGGRALPPSFGNAYGNLVLPVQHGSAGGGRRLNVEQVVEGGSGGGVIILNVGGALQVDGVLDASGRNGRDLNLPSTFAGGGAGGSINIRSATLRGAGIMRAGGGRGALLDSSSTAINGGGGGGRIAVDTTAEDTSSIEIEAKGGLTGHDDLPSSVPYVGGAGTIYMHAPAQEHFDLTLIGPDTLGAIAGTHFEHALLVDTLTVTGAVIQWTGAPQDIIVYSSLTLAGQFGITAATFSFPTGGIHCFIIPAGSHLTVSTLSQDPNWDWLVNGRLVINDLKADDFVSSGYVQTRNLDVARLNLMAGELRADEDLIIREASDFTVPAGAYLSAKRLILPAAPWSVAGTALVGGSFTATSLALTGDLSASTLTIQTSAAVDILAGARLVTDSLSASTAVPWSVSGELRLGSRLDVSSLHVRPGGVVGPSKNASIFEIVSSGDILVDAGAVVDANGRGYRDTTGYGFGPGAGCESGGGGGHGGLGGVGQPDSFPCRTSGLQIYGDRSDPRAPGSSGASYRGDVSSGRNSFGGPGGGAVILSAVSQLTLDGLIDARGGDGISEVGRSRGGGGSGGSVNLRAEVVAGNGTIRAGGGNGSPSQFSAPGDGGGGGGGRVAVVAESRDMSALSIDVSGGLASRPNLVLPMPGDPGSIFRLPLLAVSSDGAASLSSHVEGTSITPVAVSSAPSAYAIAVFGQGLSPLSSFYEITPSPISFMPPAQFSVSFDPAAVDTNTIAIYYFDGVSWDSATATGQVIEVLGPSLARISGLLPHASLYAVMSRDALAPSLVMTPPSGSTVTTDSPSVSLAYADAASGVSTATLRVYLDGVALQIPGGVTASSAVIPLSGLTQGTHTVTAEVADYAGNRAAAASTFLVDSLPPETTLSVNGLAVSATSLALLTIDSLGLSAFDLGTGVSETRYAVDGATETPFVSTFSLSAGAHTLTYLSVDYAGNVETAHQVAVQVRPSDANAPLTRLDYPVGGGVESAVGGVVTVRGVVADESGVSWTLTAGSATLATGAGPVAGALASWDTAGLSGYHTLTLTAADVAGNAASTSAVVFVGNPVFVSAIGRKDSDVIVSSLKNPTGIVVRPDGLIWVAKTADEDGLLLLTSSGTVLAQIGRRHGHGHDDDDDGGLRFKSPQGLALDAADNLYVADKGNDRVLKLSPDGSQVLLQLARLQHGKPKSGSGPGQFKRPQDVAVDGNGDIYIADSGNRRIQVLDASGAFQREFGAGVFLSTSEIRGIALTSKGLWVSDKELSRVYLFTRAGAVLKTIDDADSVVGEISRTRGLAADRLGNLYLIEPNRDRVQKFSPEGRGQLSFGTRSQATPAEKAAKRYLNQPLDAAMGPDGSLWVTDTGRDRIVRYALPASGGYGVAAFSTGGGAGDGDAEPAKRVVEAKDGARVERDDGTGVSIPKDALPADLEVSVAKADENVDSQEKQAKMLEKRIKSASDEVEYGPEGTRFNKPVTLTIAYTPTPGLDEKNLKVHYWNPQTKDWEALDSVVDTVAKTVSAQTTHFSVYQVQGAGTGFVTGAAVDEFGLRDQYAFPNPSRRGQAVTFRIQPGLADSVELRVYDLAGRKVHSSSQFTLTTAFDDGNGKGAQHTYDHVWNVSGIGSGVYYYIMVAKKAGAGDITVRGKTGVIK